GYQDELRHRSYMENAAKKQSNRAA
ncbi:MAG: hypothetical protein JWM96_1229, partial [Alphaproteobacteria bacterium]|nr:hypothetical protein [Alphaproteobacteria bacterium]